MKHLEVANSYDGYEDYEDAVAYDYTDDIDEDDYEKELDLPKWLRV
jgi:hypothetical protein